MKKAKPLQNAKSQTIRLHKEYHSSQEPWKTLFESLEQFSDDFMSSDRKQPESQTRESAFE